MAVIYLRHPEFGTKVATMDAEAEHDKEHGYEEYDPTAPEDELVEEVVLEAEPVNNIQPKRRGRPPRQEQAA